MLWLADRHDWPRVTASQIPYSLLRREYHNDLAFCTKHNVGVTAYQVLQGGLLTGKYRRGSPAPADSRLAEKPEWVWKTDAALFDRLEAFAKLAAEAGVPAPHYAVAWTLTQPAMSSVIIRAKRVDQVQDAVAAAQLRLPPENAAPRRRHLRPALDADGPDTTMRHLVRAMSQDLPLGQLLEQLREFDTALLANTIGYIDPTPAHEFYMGGSIRSVTPLLGPTVGIAVTCELDSSTPNNVADIDGFWRQLEYMQSMELPSVWVVKACGARPDHECILGDGMAKTLVSVGCVGAVTNGGVRDINGLTAAGFAAYCKGTTIHHTSLRFGAGNVPLEIGGIVINPGDVIDANAEGVIKVPAGCHARIVDAAVRMRAFEYEAHLAQCGDM